MPEPPRFSFSPLERRGILLGLQTGQLVTVGVGAVVALVVHSSLGGAGGNALAFLAVTAALTGAMWTRQGRPLVGWAILGAAWLGRGGRRTRFNQAPLTGRPCTHRGLRPPSSRGRTLGPCVPAGVVITEDEGGATGEGYGVIRDRRTLAMVAVVPVRGLSFSLLDPDEQLQRLDAWRTVLAAVARPGTPVTRLQWLQRSGPAGQLQGLDPAPAPEPGGGAVDAAMASYRELVGQVAPEALRHDTWVALAVGADRRPGGGAGREVLGRELRFLQGQLRQAGLEPGRPLDRASLGLLVEAGSMAARESWSALQMDGALHATFWVAEWPRVEVGPDFLVPLLMGRGRRAVSVVMAPVAPDRALREVRSARTADLADAELRSRAGFLSSARRDREAEGVTRREQELAQGHAEYRFSAYVSVSAEDHAALAAACSELEQSAQATRLELRRLYGRQAEAYTWTLPLGRGLR